MWCVCFRLWHTACLGPDGEVFVFGGCANNLLAQHRAVRASFYLSRAPVLCISEMFWIDSKLLLPSTGTQQWVIDLQRSAQITSQVSVPDREHDHLYQINGNLLTPHFKNVRALFWPSSLCAGSAWRPFSSTGSVCLSTGTACLNTSCTASNWGWLTSTHWAPSLRRKPTIWSGGWRGERRLPQTSINLLDVSTFSHVIQVCDGFKFWASGCSAQRFILVLQYKICNGAGI